MPGYVISLLLLMTIVPVEAGAQYLQAIPPAGQTVNLTGVRVGATFLPPGVRDLARDLGREVGPVISQFGWQFERRFLTSPDGGTGVTEFVGLIGGVEQDLVLPSLSWLVGFRTANGLEVAAGPNLSVSGTALALAAGVTFRAGNLNLPVNIAVVPSKSGMRVSLLAGFNSRR